MPSLWQEFLFSIVSLWLLLASSVSAQAAPLSPAAPPEVQNAGMECAAGYVNQPGVNGLVPAGWTAVILGGQPTVHSTRRYFSGGCDPNAPQFIERLEGADSLVVLAQDIETPPAPGKPFDVALYQRVAVEPGVAYSLSGWFVSLCGGSAVPNDCPSGYYMAKMLGLDPTGGSDPLSPTVVWVEDRRNFTESRWANLRLGATAQGKALTLFVRIRSPYQWHGNHALVDAISLLHAPTAEFVNLPATVYGPQVTVAWRGTLGPDVEAILGGTYALRFDVEYRQGNGGWKAWQTGQPAGSAMLNVNSPTGVATLRFRVRPRAEQPDGSGGVFPNHRYPGVWATSPPVTVVIQRPTAHRRYLPLVQ